MKKILLVDDDPLFYQFVDSALTSCGASCVVVDNGDKISQLDVNAFDHVLLDLNVPGQDGLQVLGYLKQCGYSSAVSILSGSDTAVLNSAKQVATNYGLAINKVLQKPFSITELFDVVNTEPATSHVVDVPIPHIASEPQMADKDLLQPLQIAIETRQIEVYFQPKIELASHVVLGFEQLARWSLDNNFVSPDIFIPIAEENDLINDFTRLVVDKGFDYFQHYLKLIPELTLSLNISAKSLSESWLPDFLLKKCDECKIPAKSVILELTETSVVGDDQFALEVLTRLRIMGFGLSIDDFGTGYSSISQLRKIPFTELKIDRTFTQKFCLDRQSREIVISTINMATRLGLDVVAEGIEDQDTRHALLDCGALVGQGYLFAKPMSHADAKNWLIALDAKYYPSVDSDKDDLPSVILVNDNRQLSDDIHNIQLMKVECVDRLQLSTLLEQRNGPQMFMLDQQQLATDCYQLSLNIKNRLPEAIVILLTRESDQTTLLCASDAQIDDVIRLPVDAGEVVAKLHTAKQTPLPPTTPRLNSSAELDTIECDDRYAHALSQLMFELHSVTMPEQLAQLVYQCIEQLDLSLVICLRHSAMPICFCDGQNLGSETEYHVFELFKHDVGMSQFGNSAVYTGHRVSLMLKEVNVCSIRVDQFIRQLLAILDCEMLFRDPITFSDVAFNNTIGKHTESSLTDILYRQIRSSVNAEKTSGKTPSSMINTMSQDLKSFCYLFNRMSQT